MYDEEMPLVVQSYYLERKRLYAELIKYFFSPFCKPYPPPPPPPLKNISSPEEHFEVIFILCGFYCSNI